MAARKDYLGDSVYAEFDGFGVMLTTENGGPPSNEIYLEPNVLRALNNYWARAWATSEDPPASAAA